LRIHTTAISRAVCSVRVAAITLTTSRYELAERGLDRL
jgi:hypothetical protein